MSHWEFVQRRHVNYFCFQSLYVSVSVVGLSSVSYEALTESESPYFCPQCASNIQTK